MKQAIGEPAGTLTVLDAGCGTGLCGPLLRPYAAQLTGVDLSSGMLDQAGGRGVYDDLVQAELTSYLAEHLCRFDLIVTVDTLCYFGELGSVGVGSQCRSGGVAARGMVCVHAGGVGG